MSLRRFIAALFFLAVSGTLVSYATETATTGTKHPTSTTPAKNPDGSIKRAPVAKPFKTKSRAKHSSKSKTSTTKSVSTPAPTTHTTTAAHTKAVSLRAPAVSSSSREVITDRILQTLASPRLGIENPRALQPFFDQLHQLQADPKAELVRVIQFGDSHTAADVFTGALRTLFQGKFGDGGAGFSFPGYPFAGYRIHGTKRAQSTGWQALGTHLNDIGDAMVGMGGVSLSTEAAGNWVSPRRRRNIPSSPVPSSSPTAAPSRSATTTPSVATVSTAKSDPTAPDTAGQFGAPVEPGPHHFEVLTIDQAPVRLLGLSDRKILQA